MSRRVQVTPRRAAVITYVGDAVRPTYATDMDRYTELKILEEQLFRGDSPHRSAPPLFEGDIPYGTPADRPIWLALQLTKNLVTPSTDATEIQRQLDGATHALYHIDYKKSFSIQPYWPTNDYAPLCLIPHKVLPIVLEGRIQRNEETVSQVYYGTGGHFNKEDHFDLTYQEFQTNNFCQNPMYHADAESYKKTKRRYRMYVQNVHFRGKPVGDLREHTSPPLPGLSERSMEVQREQAMRKMIWEMKWPRHRQMMRTTEGYNASDLRNIRTMFNNPNFDKDQQEFYEWHKRQNVSLYDPSTQSLRAKFLPLVLQLPPQARDNPEFEKLNDELGIQFPNAAATVHPSSQWPKETGFFIGFDATDFTAGDSNVFFAETTKRTKSDPLPIALVNPLPYTEDEDEQFEPEPEHDSTVTDEKHELQRFKSMIAQQRSILRDHQEFTDEEKREYRKQWLGENKRQPTATEMAQESIVVRTALFPARFADRVNYLDPKVVQQVQNGTITDRQRADLLLDFVCSYPNE